MLHRTHYISGVAWIIEFSSFFSNLLLILLVIFVFCSSVCWDYLILIYVSFFFTLNIYCVPCKDTDLRLSTCFFFPLLLGILVVYLFRNSLGTIPNSLGTIPVYENPCFLSSCAYTYWLAGTRGVNVSILQEANSKCKQEMRLSVSCQHFHSCMSKVFPEVFWALRTLL